MAGFGQVEWKLAFADVKGSWAIGGLFGIYLVCGAPHFVRWQVKKTRELLQTA